MAASVRHVRTVSSWLTLICPVVFGLDVFGTTYDVSTILILWFAGASAMAGMLNLIPRSGMSPEWAGAVRPLVLVLTGMAFLITWIFDADADADVDAYATGVLVLMTSAAVAVTLAARKARQRRLTVAFSLSSLVFTFTTLDNVHERPDGAAAVQEIDRRLRAEIRERRRHRQRIALLAAGDSLALPPEAVTYLERLRAVGVPAPMVDAERDAWILVTAQLPDRMTFYMEMKMKNQQLDDENVRDLYRDMAEVIQWPADDPRLDGVADRLAAEFDSVPADGWDSGAVPDDLAALLDAVFLDSVPGARRILSRLEERLDRMDQPASSGQQVVARPGLFSRCGGLDPTPDPCTRLSRRVATEDQASFTGDRANRRSALSQFS